MNHQRRAVNAVIHTSLDDSVAGHDKNGATAGKATVRFSGSHIFASCTCLFLIFAPLEKELQASLIMI